MRMVVHSRGKDAHLLRAHAQKRLNFALDRFAHAISRVSIWIEDQNGPKGGADMRCHVEARFVTGGVVVVREQAADAYLALDHAARRLARNVSRAYERARSRSRERFQVPAVVDLAEAG